MADLAKALRTAALEFPGTSEGVACAGTALETRTLKVGSKAFLFLRRVDLRLKLGASLPAARRAAEKDPERLTVGAKGWVWVALEDPLVSLPTLRKWARESYDLFARPAAGRR